MSSHLRCRLLVRVGDSFLDEPAHVLVGDVDSFRQWAEAIKPVLLLYAAEKGLRVRDLLDSARTLRVQAVRRGSMASEAQTALQLDPNHAEYLVEILEEAQRASQRQ